MTWKLHNFLKTELERYGITVLRTREEQALDLSLQSRGRKAKGADLFLSLHSNACDDSCVDRPVAICLVDDDCGRIDGASREIAELLATTVAEVMQTKGKPQVISRLSAFDRDGDGKRNDDYYGVLYGAHQAGCAGVILEHSFHTNEMAAKWLLDEDHLKELAEREAAVIAAYYGISGSVHTEKPVEKVDFAHSYQKGKTGVYLVVSSDGILNLRTGAGADKQLIEAMPTGSQVQCFGYYTGDWLYVVSPRGNTGFCHGAYLKKVK